MCRFLNADGIIGENKDILANNLFAYCSNDPISYSDSTGQGKIKNWIKKTWNDFKNSTSAKVNALVQTMKKTVTATLKSVGKIYKTTERPKNIGAGTWSKMVNSKLGKISKVNKVLDGQGVGVAIDVGSSIVGDLIDGAPAKEIVNNAMTELMFGMAGIAVGTYATSLATAFFVATGIGAAFASPFVLGAAVGAVAIFAFSVVVDYAPANDISIKDRVKLALNEG